MVVHLACATHDSMSRPNRGGGSGSGNGGRRPQVLLLLLVITMGVILQCIHSTQLIQSIPLIRIMGPIIIALLTHLFYTYTTSTTTTSLISHTTTSHQRRITNPPPSSTNQLRTHHSSLTILASCILLSTTHIPFLTPSLLPISPAPHSSSLSQLTPSIPPRGLLFVDGQSTAWVWPDTHISMDGAPVTFQLTYDAYSGSPTTIVPVPNGPGTVVCASGNVLPTQPNHYPFQDACTFTPPAGQTMTIEIDWTSSPPSSYNSLNVSVIPLNSTDAAYVSPTLFGGGDKGAWAGYRNGDAEQALFNQIGNPCLNSAGNIMYIPDAGNHVIRQWNLDTNLVDTLWGPLPTSNTAKAVDGSQITPGYLGSSSNVHPTHPDLNGPHSVVMSADNQELFISEFGASTIRRITFTSSTPSSMTQLCGNLVAGTIIAGTGSGSSLPYPGALVLVENSTNRYLFILLNGGNGQSPVLARMNLNDGSYTITLMTASATRSPGPPIVYHHDSTDNTPSGFGFLGFSSTMVLSADCTVIYILSTATAPASGSSSQTAAVPSILRHYRLDDGILQTALSWYYSPAEPILGVVKDGFPDNQKPSTQELVGFPTAMTLSIDNRYMYFLDMSGFTVSTQPDSYMSFPCSLPGYTGVDCGTSIRRLDLVSGEVSTLAGGRATSADGVGSAAGIWSGTDPANTLTSGLLSTASPHKLLMHPSGQYMYVLEGTTHSRIRKFTFATNELLTVAGGGGATAPHNLFGLHDGYGTDALFATPQALTTDSSGRYVYVSDSYSLSKIDLLRGHTHRVHTLQQNDLRQQYRSGNDSLGPKFNNFFPIIADPLVPNRIWFFQLLSANLIADSPIGMFRLDTGTGTATTQLVPDAVQFTPGSYQATQYATSDQTNLYRVLSGTFDRNSSPLLYLCDMNVAHVPINIVSIDISSITPMANATVVYTVSSVSDSDLGPCASMVFNGDSTRLYCLDIFYRRIVYLDFVDSPPTFHLLAGSTRHTTNGEPAYGLEDGQTNRQRTTVNTNRGDTGAHDSWTA